MRSHRVESGVRPRQVCLVLAAVVLTLASAAAATAGQQKSDAAPAADAQQARASLQAFVDPATGRLRQPTPAEARFLAEAVAQIFTRSADQVVTTTLADGSVVADVDGLFMNVVIATVEDDGSVKAECVDNPYAAAILLATGAELEEK